MKKNFMSKTPRDYIPMAYYFIEKDIILKKSSKRRPSLLKTLKMWKKGFFEESHYLFDLENNDSDLFLSNYERMKTRKINGDYGFLLNNKVVFNSMLEKKLNVPKIYAIIEKNSVLNLSKEKVCSFEDILRVLKKEKNLILKSNSGYGGKGVFKLSFEDGKFFLNYKEFKKKEIIKKLKSLNQYIVNQCIDQRGYANKIFPDSVNTLRIVSYIDPYNQEPFIGIAVHRFGTQESKPTDNFQLGKGGLVCLVDVDSGVLKEGRIMKKDFSGILGIKEHPDSKERIEGVKVPMWEKTKRDILEAHSSFPFMPHIAWDVCMTEGKFFVLEGNNHSDIALLQVNKPLLTDERIKSFYKYHGILSKKR